MLKQGQLHCKKSAPQMTCWESKVCSQLFKIIQINSQKAESLEIFGGFVIQIRVGNSQYFQRPNVKAVKHFFKLF